MFLQKRVINGVEYKYLDHSFRIGNKIQKVSFIVDKNRQDYNEEIIRKIAAARAAHFKEHGQTYFSQEEITKIEIEKMFYHIFYNALDPKSKQEILDEFV